MGRKSRRSRRTQRRSGPRTAHPSLRRRAPRRLRDDRTRPRCHRLRPHLVAVEVRVLDLGTRLRQRRPTSRGSAVRGARRSGAVPRIDRVLRSPRTCGRCRRARQGTLWSGVHAPAPAGVFRASRSLPLPDEGECHVACRRDVSAPDDTPQRFRYSNAVARMAVRLKAKSVGSKAFGSRRPPPHSSSHCMRSTCSGCDGSATIFKSSS